MIENYCHPAWTFRPARKAKRSLILGFGRNDLEFATNQNWFDPELGKTVILRYPAYEAWHNMLSRAYSSANHSHHPWNQNTIVKPEWSSLKVFTTWYNRELVKTGLNSHKFKLQVDKDLLNDTRIYDKCLLVPSDLNLFLGNNRSRRGKYLIGASWHKKDRRFRSRIYVNNQQTHLGNFEDEMSAHLRWREEKIKLANQFELPNWWSKTRCDLVRRRLRKLIRMMR